METTIWLNKEEATRVITKMEKTLNDLSVKHEFKKIEVNNDMYIVKVNTIVDEELFWVGVAYARAIG